MARFGSATLASAAIACVLAATPALTATTTFTDQTLNDADYTLGAFKDPSLTVGAYGQTAIGGNPGPGLQGTTSSSGPNALGVLFTALNNGFVYDPGATGPITSLDVSPNRFSNPIVDGAQSNVGSYSLRLLAAQAGDLYQAAFVFGPFNSVGGTRNSLSRSGIPASNFFRLDSSNYFGSDSVGGLDFTGSAITSGFAMRSAAPVDSNGQPTAAPASNDLRADNFALTIHSTEDIPKPAT